MKTLMAALVTALLITLAPEDARAVGKRAAGLPVFVRLEELKKQIEESKQVGQRDVLSAVEPPGPVLTLDVLDADLVLLRRQDDLREEFVLLEACGLVVMLVERALVPWLLPVHDAQDLLFAIDRADLVHLQLAGVPADGGRRARRPQCAASQQGRRQSRAARARC